MFTESLNNGVMHSVRESRLVGVFKKHRYAALVLFAILLSVIMFGIVLNSNTSDEEAFAGTKTFTNQRTSWNPWGEQGRGYYYDYVGYSSNSVGWWAKGDMWNYGWYYLRGNAARAAGYGAFYYQWCVSSGGSSSDKYSQSYVNGGNYCNIWGSTSGGSSCRAYIYSDRYGNGSMYSGGWCTWVDFYARAKGYDGSRFSTKYLDTDIWMDLYCYNTSTGGISQGYLSGDPNYYATSKRLRFYLLGNNYYSGNGTGIQGARYRVNGGSWQYPGITNHVYGGRDWWTYIDTGTIYGYSGQNYAYVEVQFWDWINVYTSYNYTVPRMDANAPSVSAGNMTRKNASGSTIDNNVPTNQASYFNVSITDYYQSAGPNNDRHYESNRGSIRYVTMYVPGRSTTFYNTHFYSNSYRGSGYSPALSLTRLYTGSAYRGYVSASLNNIAGNGSYYFTGYDYGGRYFSTGATTIDNYDAVAPTIPSYSYDPSWKTGSTTLYFSVNDTATSGCASSKYGCNTPTISGGSCGTVTLQATSGKAKYYSVALYDTATYTIKVTDLAGNVRTVGGITPHIDKSNPTWNAGSLSVSGTKYDGSGVNAQTAYSYNNVTISASISDAGGSGFRSVAMQCSKDAANWTSFSSLPASTITSTTSSGGGYGTAPNNNTLYNKNYTYVTGNVKSMTASFTTSHNTSSYQYYRYVLTDYSGRTYYSSAIQVLKDNVAPNVYQRTDPNDNKWSKSNQTVNFKSSYGWSGAYYAIREKNATGSWSSWMTAGSGVNIPDYTYTQSKEGQYGYQLRITSGAGYIYYTPENYTYTRIDKTAPSATLTYRNLSSAIVSEVCFTGTRWYNKALKIRLSVSEASANTSGISAIYATIVSGGRTVTVNGSNATMSVSGSSGTTILGPTLQTPLSTLSPTFVTYPGYNLANKYGTYNNYLSGGVEFSVTGNIKYVGGTATDLAPTFYISLVDAAGNVRNVFPTGKRVQVDTYTGSSVALDSKVAKVKATSALTNYDSSIQNNWVFGQIEYNLSKTMGLSGGTVKYYIAEPNVAVSTIRNMADSAWLTLNIPKEAAPGVKISGDGAYNSTAKLTISNVNISGRVFFAIFPNATGESTTERSSKAMLEAEGSGKSIFCAVDISPPSVVSYEFQYGSSYLEGKSIKKEDYAASNLYLYVVSTDVLGSSESLGSDIDPSVSNGVSNGVWAEYGSGNRVYFRKDTSYSHSTRTRWVSSAPVGSASYSIKLVDKVGNVNTDQQTTGKTHVPLIDTEIPTLTLGTGTYVPAKVTKQTVEMSVAVKAGKSGSMVYYILRNPDNTASLASIFASESCKQYHTGVDGVNNKSGYYTLKDSNYMLLTASGKEGAADARTSVGANTNGAMTISNSVYGNPSFNTTYNSAARNVLQIGLNGNQTMKIALDFVIINGAGVVRYYQYGIVWVDKQVPVVDDDIAFLLNDGTYQMGIFDNYTNGSASADITVNDPSSYGSGVAKVVIDGVAYTSENAIQKQVMRWNGSTFSLTSDAVTAYPVVFNEKKEYKIQCFDNAGNASAAISFTPKIDKKVPTIEIDENNKDYSSFVNTDIIYKVVAQFGLSGGIVSYSLDGSHFYNLPTASSSSFNFQKFKSLGTTKDSGIVAKITYTDNRNNPGQNGIATQMDYEIRLTSDVEQQFWFKLQNGVTLVSQQRYQTNDDGSFVVVNGNLIPLDYNISNGKRVYIGRGIAIPTQVDTSKTYKIDKTAPSLVDNTLRLYVKDSTTIFDSIYYLDSGTAWTNKTAKVQFSVTDENNKNVNGEIITLQGVGGVIVTEIINEGSNVNLSGNGGSYFFNADNYYSYKVRVSDSLGNYTTLFSYRPRIDTTKPTIALSGRVMLNETGASMGNYPDARSGGYTVGDADTRWVEHDVRLSFATAMGLSGAKVYHSTTGLAGSWVEISASGANVPALSDKANTGRSNFGVIYAENGSINHYYKIISGAGESVECKFDSAFAYSTDYFNISKDDITPKVKVTVKTQSKNIYIADTWTAESVTWTVEPNGALYTAYGPSGYYAEHSIDNSSWETVGTTKYTVGRGNTAKEGDLTVNSTESSVNNQHYFRLRSLSGKCSAVYNFGKIKIDKVQPDMNFEYKVISTNNIVTGGGGAIDYAATFEAANDYVLGKWTFQNVIVRVNLSTIGLSGASLCYTDEATTTPSDIFNNSKGNSNWKASATSYSNPATVGWTRNAVQVYNANTLSKSSAYAYLIVSENQSAAYYFKALSNAGRSRIRGLEDRICKDDAMPFVYIVDNQTAEKSVKWTSNSVNDYYKWFTSNYIFDLRIGRYKSSVPSGTPETKVNASGYTLYVRTNKNPTWAQAVGNEYISSGSDRATLAVKDNDADGDVQYEFKVVSGAGLEFYPKESYTTEANRTIMGDGMITKILNSDEYGLYTVRVDTTSYSASYTLKLEGSSKITEVEDASMATVSYMKNGIALTDEEIRSGAPYKRGDSVSVNIVANEENRTAAKPYYFEYKFSKFSNLLVENYHSGVSPSCVAGNTQAIYGSNRFYSAATVTENNFTFDFYNENYAVTAFFRKYFSIDYATETLSQFKQGTVDTFSDIKPVSVSTTQAEFRNGDMGLIFKVKYIDTYGYHDIPGTESYTNPTDIGKYDLKVEITNDEKDTYKIINDANVESLYYFFTEGSEAQPYLIRNEIDFNYMKSYNNPLEKYDFLNMKEIGASLRSYSYTQMCDISLENEDSIFSEGFSGLYNGSNFILTMGNLVRSGSFGIFNKIKSTGSVENLGVKIDRLTINNASSVGYIATEVDGGIINNCYAIGDLYINGSALKAGGIAGSLTGSGRISNTFTDLTVYNLGLSLSGNLGGVVGYINDGIFYNNAASGAIEIYDVETNVVKIGTVVGSIEAITENVGGSSTINFRNNSYLKNNLFINDEVIEYESYNVNAGIGYINIASVDFYTGDAEIESVAFNEFIREGYDIADKYIADVTLSNKDSKQIKTLIKTRIAELGISQGEGTANNPFIVDSIEALDFIDRYAWASFMQNGDIASVVEEFRTIAAHKVFTGSYDGQNYSISDITIVSSDVNTGIFGQIKTGTVKNVQINNINISVNYTGTSDTYVGGLAAKVLNESTISNVSIRGNTSVYTPSARAIVGGLFGYTAGGTDLLDILSLQNVKTEEGTLRTVIGGTVGIAEQTSMNYIFSMARVEAYSRWTGDVGAVIGEIDSCTGINDLGVGNVYAIQGNTYYGGEPHECIYGTTHNDSYNGELKDFTTMRNSSVYSNGVTRLDSILNEVYPLQGKGTELKPFEIHSIDDFMYIYDYLYATYILRTDIDFAAADVPFTTIGVGSRFTGSINGTKDEATWSEGDTRTHEIRGLTNALVYYNSGTLQNLRLNVEYGTSSINGIENPINVSSDIIFGAVAIYNSGKIKGITAGGSININVVGAYSAYVGGFVGQDVGGTIEGSPSFTQASLNQIVIKVTTKMGDVGGFIGNVSGPTKLAYIVSVGDIYVYGSDSIKVGALVGGVYVNNTSLITSDETTIDPQCSVYLNDVAQYDTNGELARPYGYQLG